MNQEFRAWYKSDDPKLLFEDILKPNESRLFINKEHDIIYSFESPFIDNDFIVEQWTGLKDRTGKKIFEGDILRIPAKDKWEEKNYLSYEVFYHDNDCAPNNCVGFKIGRCKCHGALGGGMSRYDSLPKYTKLLEITGNIHEEKKQP